METVSEKDVSKNNITVRVEGLRKWFPILGGVLQRTVGYVYAVEDVTFDIKKACLLYTSPSPRD